MKKLPALLTTTFLVLATFRGARAVCIVNEKRLITAEVVRCEPARQHVLGAIARKDHKYGWPWEREDPAEQQRMDEQMLAQSDRAVILTLSVTAEQKKTWEWSHRLDRPRRIRISEASYAPRVEEFWRDLQGEENCSDYIPGASVMFVSEEPCSCEILAPVVTGHRVLHESSFWEYPEAGDLLDK